jgi:hypothetical protein
MTGSPLRRAMHDNRNNHKAEAEVGLHLRGQPSLAGLSQASSCLRLNAQTPGKLLRLIGGPRPATEKSWTPCCGSVMRTATQHESRTGPLSCRVTENRALERSNVRADCVVWGTCWISCTVFSRFQVRL